MQVQREQLHQGGGSPKKKGARHPRLKHANATREGSGNMRTNCEFKKNTPKNNYAKIATGE